MRDAGDTDLDALIAAVGWTRAGVARRLGVDSSTVDDWCARRRHDARVEAWLRDHLAYQRAHPMPEGWLVRLPGTRGRPRHNTRAA